MRALVFDFGLRRIGVAVAEADVGHAHALGSIGARDGAPHWPPLDTLVARWQPTQLVVGLPLNMDGTRSAMCDRAEAFGARMGMRYGLPPAYADERLSTFEAIDRGASPKDAHALAAAVIAETWLASVEAPQTRAQDKRHIPASSEGDVVRRTSSVCCRPLP